MADTPTFTAFDVEQKKGERTVYVRIRRTTPRDGYSIPLSWGVRNGQKASAPQSHDPSQVGVLLFPHDVDEVRLPIRLNVDLRADQSVKVLLGEVSFWGALDPKLLVGEVFIKGEGAGVPALADVASWVTAGPIKRERPAAYQQTFSSNLIDGFKVSDSGFDEAGKPCWRNQPAHGKMQEWNKEAGPYASLAEHGRDAFPIINGKRAILALRDDAKPAIYKGKPYPYTGGMLTTEKLFRMGYGWREVSCSVEPVRGGWPACWSKSGPAKRWPPEDDDLEVTFTSSTDVKAPPFFVQHWLEGDDHVQAGIKFDLSQYLPGFRWGIDQTHVFAKHWTPEVLEWIVDGYLVASQPCRIHLVPTVPGEVEDEGRHYIKLNMALGGPMAPPPEFAKSAAMLVDYVKVWEPARVEPEQPKPEPEQPKPVDPKPEEPKPQEPPGDEYRITGSFDGKAVDLTIRRTS